MRFISKFHDRCRLLCFILSTSWLFGQSSAANSKFTAIADIPYSDEQAARMIDQMNAQVPSDSAFLIHLGDMRSARAGNTCTREEFEAVADILKLSPIPVFAVLGDNDWNDCPNSDEALEIWEDIFVGFEDKYWNHTLNVTRQPLREQNFAFQDVDTLYIGLNLVGGRINDQNEWDKRLSEQAEWTKELIQSYYDGIMQDRGSEGGSVVIFGQAYPTSDHVLFFDPMQDFIENDLDNKLPIMYLNGDWHIWNYEARYRRQESWLHITISGEAYEPPTNFKVSPPSRENMMTGSFATNEVFQYDRQMPCESCGFIFPGQRQYRISPNGRCRDRCLRFFNMDYWQQNSWGCGSCDAPVYDLDPS